MRHYPKDQLDLICKIWTAERQVQTGAGVEHHYASIRVVRARIAMGHPERLRATH